uniref:HNH endonuclease n=1 Tax=Florenciella sp. virus SA2 TaxID=3240092 RepID=A0AB39JFC3_9VIRU
MEKDKMTLVQKNKKLFENNTNKEIYDIEQQYKLYINGDLNCSRIEGAHIINKYNKLNRMKRGWLTCHN